MINLKLPADMDLHDLIGLISDPTSMKAYLAKLEALSDEIALQIDIKVTLDEVRAMRASAQRDKAAAAALLDATQDEIVTIRTQTAQEATSIREQISRERESLQQQEASFAVFHKLECDKVKTREAACSAQERELAGAQERVASKTAWADQMIEQYKGKLSKLKEFASQV